MKPPAMAMTRNTNKQDTTKPGMRKGSLSESDFGVIEDVLASVVS